MKKLGGHRIFSWEIGGSQKNHKIFGWLQILMKIMFNEIAPKMHISCATCIGGYMFLQHCSSGGGGHIFFDHQIGGSQKYCQGTFRNSWPPHSKENGDSLSDNYFCPIRSVMWLHQGGHLCTYFAVLIFHPACSYTANFSQLALHDSSAATLRLTAVDCKLQ